MRGVPRLFRSDQWFALGTFTLGGLGRGKQEVHGLPCRAGPPHDRATRRRPRLRRVSPRPPRPGCVASGNGRLGLYHVSSEPLFPSRPRSRPAERHPQGDAIRFRSIILTSSPPGPRDPPIRSGSRFNHALHLAHGLTLEPGGMPADFRATFVVGPARTAGRISSR